MNNMEKIDRNNPAFVVFEFNFWSEIVRCFVYSIVPRANGNSRSRQLYTKTDVVGENS